MPSYLINGGCPLYGDIIIQGSKNAALPILAAAVLTEEVSIIRNVPGITDVEEMLHLLQMLGVRISRLKGCVRIDPSGFTIAPLMETAEMCQTECGNSVAEGESVLWSFQRLRASNLLLGAMLGRLHHACIGYPGGCRIGARPFDLHVSAMRSLGAEVAVGDEMITAVAPEGLVGAEIAFSYPSVGATENAVLASVSAAGETVITGASIEPEVVMLCECLRSMGAMIEGVGTRTLRIQGRKKLWGANYRIGGDRIVAGTYLAMTAMCGGELTVRGIDSTELSAFLKVMRQTGCRLYGEDDSITLSMKSNLMSVEKITTAPYPGFPTDLQPIVMAVMCIADGRTTIVENIFENRFTVVPQLTHMGAVIDAEGTKAVVYGDSIRKLVGSVVEAKDLRGGAALLAAGLSAHGITQLHGAEHLLRGYEEPVVVLQGLGANIC